MRARKVLLLLFILALGASFEVAWRVRDDVELGPLGWRLVGGRFYGPSFAFEESRSAEVPPGAVVSIQNSFGAVRVSSGRDGEVRLVLKKVVFVPTEDAARALADRVTILTSMDGDTLRVSTNRRDLEREGALRRAGLESHIYLEVPRGTRAIVRNEHGPVDVSDVVRAEIESSFDDVKVERVDGDATLKTRHGDVAVTSVKGALSLTSRHGDVQVRDTGGAATLDMEHGDADLDRVGALHAILKHGDLSVGHVDGNVEVRDEHSGVRVFDVVGNVTVETSFDDVTLDRIGGAASVTTRHGGVRVSEAKGPVTADTAFAGVFLRSIEGGAKVKVEHGGVEAHDLRGGAEIEAEGEDVDLDGFSGPARVVARRASVRLVTLGPLSDGLDARAENGGITLETREGGRFDLRASAEHGTVDVDLPGFEAVERKAA
ncbi:MAG TPA: DUF4097 family beta strand repeat-containing protein, partial [Vicinamibacteria bacterium]